MKKVLQMTFKINPQMREFAVLFSEISSKVQSCQWNGKRDSVETLVLRERKIQVPASIYFRMRNR